MEELKIYILEIEGRNLRYSPNGGRGNGIFIIWKEKNRKKLH